jgi:hypothetical protein
MMRAFDHAAVGILVVLVIVIGLPGCGGGDTTSDQPLSKAAFAEQMEAICMETGRLKDAQVQKAVEQQRPSNSTSPLDVEKLIETIVIPLYRESLAKMEELAPPATGEAEVDKVLGEFKAALQKLESHPGAAIKASPFEKADETATNYGIEGCAL